MLYVFRNNAKCVRIENRKILKPKRSDRCGTVVLLTACLLLLTVFVCTFVYLLIYSFVCLFFCHPLFKALSSFVCQHYVSIYRKFPFILLKSGSYLLVLCKCVCACVWQGVVLVDLCRCLSFSFILSTIQHKFNLLFYPLVFGLRSFDSTEAYNFYFPFIFNFMSIFFFAQPNISFLIPPK